MPEQAPSRWSERNFDHPLFNHQKETTPPTPPQSYNMRPYYYYYEPPRSSFGVGWVIAIFAVMIVFALGLATCGGCVMLAAVSGEDPSLQPDPAFTPDDPNGDDPTQQRQTPKAPAPTAPAPKRQPK